MADETTQETEGTTNAQSASREQTEQRTFTQEDVNRLVGEARTKERRKFEGYVDGSEVEQLRTQAETAQRELDELRAQQARAAAVATASEKAGIPLEVAQMLNGADADELTEQARRLVKLMPVHPTRTDDGGGQATAKKTTADTFAELLGGLGN